MMNKPHVALLPCAGLIAAVSLSSCIEPFPFTACFNDAQVTEQDESRVITDLCCIPGTDSLCGEILANEYGWASAVADSTTCERQPGNDDGQAMCTFVCSETGIADATAPPECLQCLTHDDCDDDRCSSLPAPLCSALGFNVGIRGCFTCVPRCEQADDCVDWLSEVLDPELAEITAECTGDGHCSLKDDCSALGTGCACLSDSDCDDGQACQVLDGATCQQLRTSAGEDNPGNERCSRCVPECTSDVACVGHFEGLGITPEVATAAVCTTDGRCDLPCQPPERIDETTLITFCQCLDSDSCQLGGTCRTLPEADCARPEVGLMPDPRSGQCTACLLPEMICGDGEDNDLDGDMDCDDEDCCGQLACPPCEGQ